jgi:BclB C-terminal domain-containing protein
LGGATDTAGLIGFGSSVGGVSIVGGTITLGAGGLGDYSFVVPRTGTVDSISAFFSATVGAITSPTVTVRAQLWSAPAASSTFTPITGAFVDLTPAYTPAVVLGTNASGTAAALGIPVVAGDKLLLVFSLVGSTSIVVDALTGFASAGVAIS